MSARSVHSDYLIHHIGHGRKCRVGFATLAPGNPGQKYIQRSQHGCQSGVDGVPESGDDCSTIGFDLRQRQTRELRRRIRLRWLYRRRVKSAHRAPGLSTPSRPATRCSRWNKSAPLSGLVLANLGLNFGSVGTGVGPGVHQIFCPERWVRRQQRLFTHAQPPRLLQKPYWYPRSNDTCFTGAHIRTSIDPGRGVTEFLNHPLQDLGFLAGRKGR